MAHPLPLALPRLMCLASLCLTLGLAAATTARADTLTGMLEKVDGGGASVTIGGKVIAISGTRTNVCIKGICDQDRDKLKPGTVCAVDVALRGGQAEARRLSCK